MNWQTVAEVVLFSGLVVLLVWSAIRLFFMEKARHLEELLSDKFDGKGD